MKLTEIIHKEYETIDQTTFQTNPLYKENVKNIKKLVNLFSNWRKKHIHTENNSPIAHNAAYHYAIEMAKEITYEKEDITRVCFEIDPFKIPKIHNGRFLFSFFLGAIIQAHYEKVKETIPHKKNEPYHIVTTQFDERIDTFGYKNNGPTIVVSGDLGDNIGNQMHSGQIIVQGNTGDLTGFGMSGGKIIVKKNTGAFAGCEQHGGFIHIYGDTSKHTGMGMTAGVLKIDGAIEYISDTNHPEEYAHYFTYDKLKKGMIIHQGKKVF